MKENEDWMKILSENTPNSSPGGRFYRKSQNVHLLACERRLFKDCKYSKSHIQADKISSRRLSAMMKYVAKYRNQLLGLGPSGARCKRKPPDFHQTNFNHLKSTRSLLYSSKGTKFSTFKSTKFKTTLRETSILALSIASANKEPVLTKNLAQISVVKQFPKAKRNRISPQLRNWKA